MGAAHDRLARRVRAALDGVRVELTGDADDELVTYAALMRRQRDEWQIEMARQSRRAASAEREAERLRDRIAEVLDALDPAPASGGD